MCPFTLLGGAGANHHECLPAQLCRHHLANYLLYDSGMIRCRTSAKRSPSFCWSRLAPKIEGAVENDGR